MLNYCHINQQQPFEAEESSLSNESRSNSCLFVPANMVTV